MVPRAAYYMPSHPLVAAYDALNMTSEAVSNIRKSQAAQGYSGVGHLNIRRLIEVPQGYVGASMYFDFNPPEAVPIAFCCGADYEGEFGVSACDAASSLIDGNLPEPHFIIHAATTGARVAPIATAGS